MSKATDTLRFLAIHNSWRRGDETFGMQDPAEIGAAIDDAVNLLRRYDELEGENAELKRVIDDPHAMQIRYRRTGNGWDVCSTERVQTLHRDNERLERENAELEATLKLVYDANQRGIKAWQQAHPDKAMVWPDQAELVEWLLCENAALRADRVDWLLSRFALPQTQQLKNNS